ncbi:MAG TPA: rhodanese-like domain-containing protein [Woeseiaceae bacterium]|jgi:rhodanese-related sulfurtransferase
MEQYLEFTANHPLLVAALTASFLLLVFTELRRKTKGATSLEPQEAVKLMNTDAVVIDLRRPEAFASGHIVNAKNIPLDELDETRAVETLRSRPVIAVCDAGLSSPKVVEKLRKAGIENAFGLKGGIAAWKQASLPLVTAKKTRKKKK